jgi:hypothetical protein
MNSLEEQLDDMFYREPETLEELAAEDARLEKSMDPSNPLKMAQHISRRKTLSNKRVEQVGAIP